MEQSIISLLEDDEDETIHSGADVEAYTVALNRDIEGDASTSQPSDSESAVLPHGSNPTSNQFVAQWQSSVKEENIVSENQLEGVKNLQQQEQHSSEVELVQCGSDANNQQQHIKCSLEHSQLPSQHKQSHDDQPPRPAEQNLLQLSQKCVVQIFEQNTVHFPEPGRIQHPDNQNQYPKLQKMNNQQPPAAVTANNPLTSTKRVPFGLLYPIITPHLDKDRAMQLGTLFTKLRKNEISKEGFIKLMRNIVGDQMLKMAVNKLLAQQQELAIAQAVRNSNTRPHQLTSLQQHQQADSSFPTSENNAQKARETKQADSQRTNVTQMPSVSMNMLNQERGIPTNSLRGLNKQQQQTHLHLPQTSFPMYGDPISNYHTHPYSGLPFTAATTPLRSHIQDSQMRPVSLHQVSSARSSGASQSLNIMSASKYEMQTSTTEAKILHGGPNAQSTNNLTMQHNAAVGQSSMNKEQKISTLSSLAYVKQEVVYQTRELSPKSQLSTSPGSSSFGAARLDHRNTSSPATLKDDVMEKQCSRVPSSTSITAVQTNLASGSTATQVGPLLMLPSSTTPLGAGVSVKTLPKKPSIGQKKPSDALRTPPTMTSKKPKVSGAFLDQSIEQLNDVTAMSGVNLREEQQQLFSGPKEDSRASEATRRVVQQEEERLILHKNPLQKKLAKILSKCGIKSVSNDVEQCLSLCVEERMHGLISNLIRLSKQRVDIENPRHRVLITSDVRHQILFMNRKATEDLEKKQTEEFEKLRKLNEAEGNIEADGEKEKDEGRLKILKANKEEDDKMRATAANVAARVAVGGDDMLSKWQFMAEQARQKHEEGTDVASAARFSKDLSRKSLSGLSTSGAMRKFGRNSVMQHTKIARSVSIKDVIAVLEREPQMSNSTLMYRLYERSR